MRLLDTQCWLWWFAQPERLNEAAITHISDQANELWFSVASIWEMSIKVALGKLPFGQPICKKLSVIKETLRLRGAIAHP